MRKRVDGELRALADAHRADVRFADARVDLHPRQVLRDQEQGRCLKARGHGLADVDVARDHGAVDRRDDVGEAEVDLGRVERRFLLADIGAVELNLRHRLVGCAARAIERVLGHDVLFSQRLIALVSDPGVIKTRLIFLQLRMRVGETRARLFDRDLVRPRVDLGADLAFFDLGVEVAIELHDRSGDVGADLHGHDWIDRAGCGYRADQVAAFGRNRDVAYRRGSVLEP